MRLLEIPACAASSGTGRHSSLNAVELELTDQNGEGFRWLARIREQGIDLAIRVAVAVAGLRGIAIT